MADEQIEFHYLADIFPLIDGVAFRDLVEDIRVNGLREPVILLDGKILDGRNRYRAAHAAQVSVRYQTYDGNDPLAFVVSANLHRRHLDASQRALIAAEITRIVRGFKRGPSPVSGAGIRKMRPLKNTNSKWAANREANIERDRIQQEQRVAAAKSRVSLQQAGELLNVSSVSVKSGEAVLRSGAAELIAAVRAGEVSVSAAAEVAALPSSQQRRIIESKGIEGLSVIARQHKKNRLMSRRVARACDRASGVAVFDHLKIGDGRSIGGVRIGECMALAAELRFLADILESAARHSSGSDDKRIRDVLSEAALSRYCKRARGEAA